MCRRQLSTFAGSLSFQRGVSVVSAMRVGFVVTETFPAPRSWPDSRGVFSNAGGRARRLVAPRELRDSLVEALQCGIGGVLELTGDQDVRAPHEGLRGPVELFAQAVGCLLADRAPPVLELECPGLAQPVDLARSPPFELLDL